MYAKFEIFSSKKRAWDTYVPAVLASWDKFDPAVIYENKHLIFVVTTKHCRDK